VNAEIATPTLKLMSGNSRTIFCGLAVAVTAAAIFLPGLGTLTLVDRDEPRFAEAARLMLASGDYFIPRFNDEVRYDKPPLTYWLMTLGYRAFGVNELGARAASAAAGIASCVALFFIARLMFGTRAGLIAGLILATTAQFYPVSRGATADAVLALAMLLMILGLWRALNGRRGLWSWLLLYGGLAAGSLTKGPVPVAVLVAMLAVRAFLLSGWAGATLRSRLGAWWSAFRSSMRSVGLLPGVGAAAVVVLAWFVPAALATEGGFLRVGFFGHVVSRAFVRSYEHHSGVFGVFYLLILPLGFFPWIAVAPESVRWLWKAANTERRAFLLAWTIAPYLVFSFLRTMLPHYILPAYPALAIICGASIDAAITDGRSFWKSALGKAGLIVSCIAGAGIAAGLVAVVFLADLPELLWPNAVLAGALLAMLTASIALFIRRRNAAASGTVAAMMAVLLGGLSTAVAPRLEGMYTMKDLALEAAQLVKADTPVVAFRVRESSLVFYLRRPVIMTTSEDCLQSLDGAFCIVAAKDEQTLERLGARKIRERRCLNLEKLRWEQRSFWVIEKAATPSAGGG